MIGAAQEGTRYDGHLSDTEPGTERRDESNDHRNVRTSMRLITGNVKENLFVIKKLPPKSRLVSNNSSGGHFQANESDNGRSAISGF